jgi:hypothetical protein
VRVAITAPNAPNCGVAGVGDEARRGVYIGKWQKKKKE